jgi:hypothetical protein
VHESPGSLVAVTDASRSDLTFGETTTTLQSIDDGITRLTYQISVSPRFWIPEFAGRHWMLNTLEQAASDLFMSVEERAKAERTAAQGT